jgi:hypothetical protein
MSSAAAPYRTGMAGGRRCGRVGGHTYRSSAASTVGRDPLGVRADVRRGRRGGTRERRIRQAVERLASGRGQR